MRTASLETWQVMLKVLGKFQSDHEPFGKYHQRHVIALFCKRSGLLSFLTELGDLSYIDVTTFPNLLKLSGHHATEVLRDEIGLIEGRIITQCESWLQKNDATTSKDGPDGEMDMDDANDLASESSFEAAWDESKWMFDNVSKLCPPADSGTKRKRDLSDNEEADADCRGDLARKRMDGVRRQLWPKTTAQS